MISCRTACGENGISIAMCWPIYQVPCAPICHRIIISPGQWRPLVTHSHVTGHRDPLAEVNLPMGGRTLSEADVFHPRRLLQLLPLASSVSASGLDGREGLVHLGVGGQAVGGVHDQLAAEARGEGHHHVLLLHDVGGHGDGVADVHELAQRHSAAAGAAPRLNHLRKFAGLLFPAFAALFGPEISLAFLLKDQPVVNHVSKGQTFHLFCQRLKAVNLVGKLLEVKVKEVLSVFCLTQAERF